MFTIPMLINDSLHPVRCKTEACTHGNPLLRIAGPEDDNRLYPLADGGEDFPLLALWEEYAEHIGSRGRTLTLTSSLSPEELLEGLREPGPFSLQPILFLFAHYWSPWPQKKGDVCVITGWDGEKPSPLGDTLNLPGVADIIASVPDLVLVAQGNLGTAKNLFTTQSRKFGYFPESDTWADETAVLLGLIPFTPQVDQVSQKPSDYTWKDVVAAVLPSCPDIGKEVLREHFTVPLLKDSILEIAISAKREQCFIDYEASISPRQHVILCGATSSGKTLLSLFLMLNACVESTNGKAMYIGPTRMLVENTHADFIELLEVLAESTKETLIGSSKVAISTGEHTDRDDDIRNGKVDASFLVYEKANHFFIDNKDLVESLSVVVIDEIHMLASPDRGVVVDAIIARLSLEAIRRVQMRLPPLRLVICTTENAPRDKILVDILRQTIPGQPILHPLPLQSPERPVPIEYWLLPRQGRQANLPLKLVDEETFKYMSRVNRRPLATGYNTLVQQWMCEHDKVIYVAPTPDKLGSFAAKLSRVRAPFPAITEEWLETLGGYLRKQDVPEGDCNAICELARYGIFLLYAQMGKNARRFIEKTYKNLPPQPFQPTVLCATSVLIYGVNLPADLLVLFDEKWPGKDIYGENVRETLEPHDFRNLTGRVGRHGHFNVRLRPRALIICNPQVDWGTRHKEIIQALLPSQVTRISTATAAFFDDNKEGGFPATAYPYPVKRIVQDALLHAHEMAGNQPCSVPNVLTVLRNTYSGRAFAGNNADRELNQKLQNLEKQAHNYLTWVVHKMKDEVLRVHGRANGSMFEPMPVLASLAKTGTEMESLEEMDALDIRIREASGYTLACHAVALVGGLPFVCEYWEQSKNIAREMRRLNTKAFATIQQSTGQNEELAKANFIAHLTHYCGQHAFATAFADTLGDYFVRNEHRYRMGQYGNDLAPCRLGILFRLGSLLLGWVGGVPVKTLHAYANPDFSPRDRGRFQASSQFNFRHADKAALVLCSYRALKEQRGTEEALVAELGKMCKCLRVGLPLDCIEDFKASTLSRDQFIAHRYIPTPALCN